jgi:hypothetical protein
MLGVRTVLAVLCAGVLVLGSGDVALAASRASPVRHPKTCVYDGTHLVGCIHRESGPPNLVWYSRTKCDVRIWGNPRWLFLQEHADQASDYAKLVRPGVWRIGGWHSGVVDARVLAVGPNRWRIVTALGELLDTVTGPDAAAAALLLLSWGRECFPR